MVAMIRFLEGLRCFGSDSLCNYPSVQPPCRAEGRETTGRMRPDIDLPGRMRPVGCSDKEGAGKVTFGAEAYAVGRASLQTPDFPLPLLPSALPLLPSRGGRCDALLSRTSVPSPQSRAP